MPHLNLYAVLEPIVIRADGLTTDPAGCSSPRLLPGDDILTDGHNNAEIASLVANGLLAPAGG